VFSTFRTFVIIFSGFSRLDSGTIFVTKTDYFCQNTMDNL
jgi:hypothetical protein